MRNRLLVKIAVIGGLTVLLLIPLAMIDGVIRERGNYRHSAVLDIAASYTGEQVLIGPLLAVPYQVEFEVTHWNKERTAYETRQKTRWETTYFMPATLRIDAAIEAEERQRGIYTVPVYTSDVGLTGAFSADEFRRFESDTQGFKRWGDPQLTVSIRDVRGIGTDPSLTINDETLQFAPGNAIPALGDGIQARLARDALVKDIAFELSLGLRGSQSLSVAPIARDARVHIAADWPHPKFSGRFLPGTSAIDENGFEADWQVSSFSTGAVQQLEACINGECAGLTGNSFGVSLIDSVNLYAKVSRATKYGLLFVLLTFVAFFLSETLSRHTLHPLHYLLVGCALVIFYLLLVSLAEHIGFAAAYLTATVACSSLIGVYLSGVLDSVREAAGYSVAIATLYAMLFAILKSEDYALMMGTLLLFTMLALIMIITRRVNWFDVSQRIGQGRQRVAA